MNAFVHTRDYRSLISLAQPGKFLVMARKGAYGNTRCELQFEYGLLQKRSRRLEHRPASFVSRNGKDISVRKDVATVNDKVQKRGTVRLGYLFR